MAADQAFVMSYYADSNTFDCAAQKWSKQYGKHVRRLIKNTQNKLKKREKKTSSRLEIQQHDEMTNL